MIGLCFKRSELMGSAKCWQRIDRSLCTSPYPSRLNYLDALTALRRGNPIVETFALATGYIRGRTPGSSIAGLNSDVVGRDLRGA